jgi:hypothetical protein
METFMDLTSPAALMTAAVVLAELITVSFSL